MIESAFHYSLIFCFTAFFISFFITIFANMGDRKYFSDKWKTVSRYSIFFMFMFLGMCFFISEIRELYQTFFDRKFSYSFIDHLLFLFFIITLFIIFLYKSYYSSEVFYGDLSKHIDEE